MKHSKIQSHETPEVLNDFVVKLNGVLAQLVEQRTFNPFVVGSIPAHPTNTKSLVRNDWAFLHIKQCISSKK
jgi:hypothetical protein